MLALALSFAVTTYTLPQDIHWLEDRSKGVPRGSYYAYIRGKASDKCDQFLRVKFPDGTTDKVEGFATEGEAGRWIRNESAAWLYNRQNAMVGSSN